MQIGLFWGFILLLSICGNIVLGIGIIRSLKTAENTEEFFNSMQDRIHATIDTMRSIDIRGAFESDDEVGGVFEQLRSMVEALDVFLISEETDA